MLGLFRWRGIWGFLTIKKICLKNSGTRLNSGFCWISKDVEFKMFLVSDLYRDWSLVEC